MAAMVSPVIGVGVKFGVDAAQTREVDVDRFEPTLSLRRHQGFGR